MQTYGHRKRIHQTRFGYLLLIVALLLTACQPIQPSAATATIPEVTIAVNDTEFTIPDNFPGGIVRVTVQNNSSQDLDIGFARLREGSSMDELMALADDFMANLVPILQKASFLYSFNPVVAGESQQVVMDFKTGEFFVDASPHVEGAPEPGAKRIVASFQANELIGTVEPETDVKVEMNDFAYIMPDTVSAGKQVWQYSNVGKQWHMQFFLKPNPGVSIEEVMAAVMSEEESSGPPPFEFVPVGGTPPISEGERVWVEFELAPGEYLAGCPIPDVAAMMKGEPPLPHIAHGMHRMLTVK